jgi:hypothetical protein
MEKAQMCLQKTIVLAAFGLYPLASLGAVTQQDIEGIWACDPYTMTGKNMTITVTEQRTYGKAAERVKLFETVFAVSLVSILQRVLLPRSPFLAC